MSTSTNSGKQNSNSWPVAFLIAAAFFAWRVWPTPYADYLDHGVKDPNKRVVRWTGKVEVRDPLGVWVEEGRQFRFDQLNQPSEAEKLFKEWSKPFSTSRPGPGTLGTNPTGLPGGQPLNQGSPLLIP